MNTPKRTHWAAPVIALPILLGACTAATPDEAEVLSEQEHQRDESSSSDPYTCDSIQPSIPC